MKYSVKNVLERKEKEGTLTEQEKKLLQFDDMLNDILTCNIAGDTANFVSNYPFIYSVLADMKQTIISDSYGENSGLITLIRSLFVMSDSNKLYTINGMIGDSSALLKNLEKEVEVKDKTLYHDSPSCEPILEAVCNCKSNDVKPVEAVKEPQVIIPVTQASQETIDVSKKMSERKAGKKVTDEVFTIREDGVVVLPTQKEVEAMKWFSFKSLMVRAFNLSKDDITSKTQGVEFLNGLIAGGKAVYSGETINPITSDNVTPITEIPTFNSVSTPDMTGVNANTGIEVNNDPIHNVKDSRVAGMEQIKQLCIDKGIQVEDGRGKEYYEEMLRFHEEEKAKQEKANINVASQQSELPTYGIEIVPNNYGFVPLEQFPMMLELKNVYLSKMDIINRSDATLSKPVYDICMELGYNELFPNALLEQKRERQYYIDAFNAIFHEKRKPIIMMYNEELKKYNNHAMAQMAQAQQAQQQMPMQQPMQYTQPQLIQPPMANVQNILPQPMQQVNSVVQAPPIPDSVANYVPDPNMPVYYTQVEKWKI